MKRSLLLVLSSALVYLMISGYSGGIAGPPASLNRTGAGGSQNDCAGSGCHDANNSDLQVSILILKGNGDTVKDGKYHPGEYYIVRLYGYFGTSTTKPLFGFQLTCEQQTGVPLNNFLPGSNMHQTILPPYALVEQTTPLSATNQKFIADIPWIPSSVTGLGNMTFYATMLAVNGDHFAIGDVGNNTQRTLTEGPPVTAVPEINSNTLMQLWPNPASDQIRLSISNADNGNWLATVYDLNGKKIFRQDFTISDHHAEHSFNLAQLGAGNYLIQIMNKDGQRTMLFTKH